MDKIFEFNYKSEEIKVIMRFEVPLIRQPEFYLLNDEQTVSIVAS